MSKVIAEFEVWADQIASYLKTKTDDAETKFTVGAIIIGAAGAITADFLLGNGDESNLPDFIGIGAGVAEATVGLAILTNWRKVDFDHQRNALSEILEGRETSGMFPAFRYYLNYSDSGNCEMVSIRQQIIQHWTNFEQVSVRTNKNRSNDIFFGMGGKYSAEQLITRANMLDQLEAHITLMKQDSNDLALELQELNWQS